MTNERPTVAGGWILVFFEKKPTGGHPGNGGTATGSELVCSAILATLVVTHNYILASTYLALTKGFLSFGCGRKAWMKLKSWFLV